MIKFARCTLLALNLAA